LREPKKEFETERVVGAKGGTQKMWWKKGKSNHFSDSFMNIMFRDNSLTNATLEKARLETSKIKKKERDESMR
jgi:hypothetical protein